VTSSGGSAYQRRDVEVDTAAPALAFNDAITRRDLAALADRMTDDHTFVDPAGTAVSGKQEVLKAWRGFFDAFPEYRNVWTQVVRDGDVMTATGHSICPTEPLLDGPAIWTVTVRGDKVAVWKVDDAR
jgi:ketosteroid isomerase-like protein